MSLENQLYQRLDRIEGKLDNNTEKTENGFQKVNGRIKKLEEYKAYQEGLSQGRKTTSAKTDSIIQRVLWVIGIFTGIISLAAASAAFVAKLAGLL